MSIKGVADETFFNNDTEPEENRFGHHEQDIQFGVLG
jgi:hypothetical protein